MEKQHKHGLFWVILVVIMLLTAMLVHVTIKNGGVNTEGTKGTETYKTIEDVQSHTSLKLTIPEGIDTDKIIEARSIMGQIIEVRAEHYVLKAASLVDVNADPLGLYDKAIIDNRYTVSNSSITFFRYRTGYEEYENCTLINWCNDTTALGIMMDEVLTEEQVIEIMGLRRDNLTKYTTTEEFTGQSEIIDENINWVPYSIGNETVTIYLPETESTIRTVDLDGYTILFLNDSRCLVVVYSDYAIDTDVFDGQGKIDIDEHTRLCYLLENEFDATTAEYRDYTIFLNNIQSIASKITRN